MEKQKVQSTNEEKLKAFIEKYRHYFERVWAVRKKLFLFNLIIFILAVIYMFFVSELYYQSTIIILPEYGNKNTSLGQLSGLAAIAGVKVGESAPTEIYQFIITSESVLSDVIFAKYKTNKFKDSVNLMQYFELKSKEQSKEETQKRITFLIAYKELSGRISTNIDRATKALTVSVKMPESKLSADVANNIAASLDNYIKTKRKSFAYEQRYYLEKRVKQVKDSLSHVEAQLENFRERNRIIEQSPALLLEQGRLMRAVDILQTVYVEITKQLELAKIDEIKEAPVINLMENAGDPVKKSGPKRAINSLIILLISVILSVIYVLLKDTVKKYYLILKTLKLHP